MFLAKIYLSAILSHAGNASKLMIVGLCAFYLAIQRSVAYSVWRDIKFAFCLFVFLFVCTVEDISTQDGATAAPALPQQQ